MVKTSKSILIFFFILVQSLLAITAGFLVLYSMTRDCIPPNVYIRGIDLGGLNNEDAINMLEKNFGRIVENKSVIIKYTNNKEFEIKYTDIDAVLDYSATLDSVCNNKKSSDYLLSLMSANINPRKRMAYPVFKINEGKLRDKLSELAEEIDREPQNASMIVKDGSVEKIAEISGLKLDIQNAIKKLKNELGVYFDSSIEFRASNNFEIEVLQPEICMQDLNGLDEIISEFSTEVGSDEEKNSIGAAVNAIDNKLILKPNDEFSFNNSMTTGNIGKSKINEGFNQVASTLYAAVLAAGIKADCITREPHITQVNYIEAGLDVQVEDGSYDFRFKNTMDSKLVISSEVRNNRIIVRIIGRKQDIGAKYTLRADIAQRYYPSVINVENVELKEGQKRMVSAGKEGLKVNVYRVALKDNVKVGEELISTDIYQSIKSIVEIGPNTKWNNETNK